MERERRMTKAFPVFFLLSSLVFQSLIATVVSRKLEDLGEQKNYYSPDPSNSGSGSGSEASHRKQCQCETPSHGGGSHGGTPSHGGGYNPSPTPPDPSSGGGYNPSPSTPPDPSSGGGYNPSPSTPSGSGNNCGPSPSIPVVDAPPGGGYYSPPSTPAPGSPAPVITTPPSPTTPDPNNPPYVPRPCSYWITHPDVIWAIFGYGGTVGGLFGASAATVFGGNPTLLQALSNTRTDAIGELYDRQSSSSTTSPIIPINSPAVSALTESSTSSGIHNSND